MMPMADLFVHVYVLVDDALRGGAVPVPPRPGRPPACSDAEVLTLAVARHGAKTVWGLLTRAAATILAHSLLRLAVT